MNKKADHPVMLVSRTSLARAMDVSESTVDELVRRGVIPPAMHLTPGCVRWSWTAVETALASLAGTTDDGDPFLTGARNAIKAASEGRRGSS